ncbi:hypothetical protein HQQ94_08315 [Shewanella sp. VB17]|nr:hypothetical protein [Shewanella sp. VB17]
MNICIEVFVKGNFCNVGKFTPSGRAKDAIKDMNNVLDMSSILSKIISMVPFFQIFAGKNSFLGVATASASYNVRTYEWQAFADAVNGIELVKKERLFFIATQAELYSVGEERKFWRCVSNAL